MAQTYSIEILLVVLSFLLVCLFQRKLNKTSVITKWPLVGMLPGVVCHPITVEYFAKVLKHSGWTFTFKGPWFLNLDFLMTSDPKNLHHILVKNSTNYPKGTDFRECIDPLGEGVISTDNDTWRNQRKISLSIVKQDKFQQLLENTIQGKIANNLLPVLDHFSEEGMELDLQDVFKRFSFDKISSLVFGNDPNYLSVSMPYAILAKALEDIEDALFQRYLEPKSWWKLKKLIQVGSERKLRRSLKCIDSFLYRSILSKWETLKNDGDNNEAVNFDILTALLQEIKKEKGDRSKDTFTKSLKFLRDFISNLAAAGASTVSVSLSWFFWLLAMNPHVEEKIMKEIQGVGKKIRGRNMGIFSVEELNKFVYLHAAVFESLRLYPPLPFNPRASIQPDVLPSGHCVGKNMRVLIGLYSAGRIEELWGKDCLEYKPERWLSEQGEILHVPSNKFAAFSDGPRTCLGKQMALIEFRMVAAAVLWNYRVQVVKGHPVSPHKSVMLYMKHGLKVRVVKRHV